MTAHSIAELQTLYRKRFEGKAEYRDRVWRVLATSFARWIPADSSVLDLGCGHCEFINNLQARERLGMDLNPDALSHAGPGVRVLSQDCASRWRLEDNSLDVVFSSNFFEHLPTKDQLRATLTEAKRCLRPGGRLIAMGPNIRYLGGAYWDFYDHHLPLSERSLAELLSDIGFTIEVKIPRCLPYTMSGGFQPPLWALKLYLRMRPAWSVFGRQFLVIAAK